MVLGLSFMALLWKGYLAAKSFDSWVETPAKVTAAWIETVPQPGSEPPRYAFRVRYQYERDGAVLSGTRLKEIPGNTRQRAKVERWEARYPVGSETVCYVNPDAAEEAVLVRPTKAPGYTLWFPGLFAVGGAGMALYGLARRHR